MEGLVEGNGDERGRPDAVRGIDQESSTDARHAVANEVGGQGNEQLVGDVGRIRLVEILGQILHPDDVVGVGRVVRHVCHDGNEHVFLFRKGPRVEGVVCAKEGEADIWQPVFAGLAHWVGQQLGDIGHDADGGLADIEQLVDEGQQTAESQTNGPASDG